MWHWILVWTGGADGNSWQYLELSGFVPACLVTGLTATGGLLYHHFRCHEDSCWRPGTHTTLEDNGHHFRRCRTHHLTRHTAQEATTLMTQPVIPAPTGVPAWAVRIVAAAVGLLPAVLAWLDPGNKLPHGAIQACIILAFLVVGASIFLVHLWLAATHEYGWNLNAARHIASEAEAEFKQTWPHIQAAYQAAGPALEKVAGVQGVIDALSADVTELKQRTDAAGLNPEAVVKAFEVATGMTFQRAPEPGKPIPPASPPTPTAP